MKNLIDHESCQAKQKQVTELFSCCTTPEQKYERIIALGRELPSYPLEWKTPDHLVQGCQSAMYLHTECKEGKIKFYVFSEALISAGLAALLLAVYDDETPEAILTYPPLFLKELKLQESLSPGRSNGLASLWQRMKQEALIALNKSLT